MAPSVASVLAGAGIQSKSLRDVFPNDGKYVSDIQWMEWAAHNGYAVLTANPRILSVPAERAAIERTGVQIFCIAKPSITKEARAFIVGRHVLSIVRKIRGGEMCFWRLYLGSPVRYDL